MRLTKAQLETMQRLIQFSQNDEILVFECYMDGSILACVIDCSFGEGLARIGKDGELVAAQA